MTSSYLSPENAVTGRFLTNNPSSTNVRSAAQANATYREFEATLLQVLIEPVLPKGQSGSRGVGADFARSQMSTFLAQSLTLTGALGIARMLADASTQRDPRAGGTKGV